MSGEEMEEDEEADIEEEEDRYGETPRGAPLEVIRMGGGVPPLKENADLLDFTSDRTHLLLQEFYGDFPHQNDGLHLGGGVADDVIWHRCWSWLAAQSASW